MSANPPAEAQLVSDMKARAEAERAGQPFLIYMDGQGRQRLFLFEPSSVSASVGRQPSSDLVLDWDDQVSRAHARFERARDGWVLVDDGRARNGTFVNQERLRGTRHLNDGDVLRFGGTTITFRSPQQGAARGPDAAAIPAAVSLSTAQRRVLVALCRPYKGRSGFASPATDQQIADEVILSLGAVRTHLKILYAKLGVAEQPQGESRVRLVERAFSAGLVSERDL